MRSTILCGLLVGGVLVGAALAAEQRPVEPGGKIGAMTVVRGDAWDADIDMFSVCSFTITKHGKYHRSCSVPNVERIDIGVAYGARSQKELSTGWRHQHWRLWVDGRPVDLPRFGTTDVEKQTNGKPEFDRKWRVILSGTPPGRHTIRYLIADPSGAIDITWAVTVQK